MSSEPSTAMAPVPWMRSVDTPLDRRTVHWGLSPARGRVSAPVLQTLMGRGK